MSALLTYALNENNQLVHIDSVENGGACKCICPNCKKGLDAKNGGEKREHHFAHSHGNVCEGAYETALHLLAKEVLLEEQKIMLPFTEGEHYPSGLVSLSQVEQEKWDATYGFRPDVEGIMPNGERLIIEFLVSHKIQKKKLETILDNNLKCIEIDLNYVELDKSAVRDFLLNETDDREWVSKKEDKPNGDGIGIIYRRSIWHQKAIDFLKSKFDTDSILISPRTGDFDLKKYKYDVCELLSGTYRGIKSDLLIYRSKEEKPEPIVISIRGRRRNFNQKIPKELRIIDIIIRDESGFNWLSRQKSLAFDGNRVLFEGFKYNYSESSYTSWNYQ